MSFSKPMLTYVDDIEETALDEQDSDEDESEVLEF
jgi:hypothetical protein